MRRMVAGHGSWFVAMAVAITTVGCNSAPVPPGAVDGGFSIRPRIVVPAAAGDALASSAIEPVVLESILSGIRPGSPLDFHYEWAGAPGMMMLGMPRASVDQATPPFNVINRMLPEKARLAPLETDIAFCAREERNEKYVPIATAPSYAPLRIPLNDTGLALEIDRISGQLADLTFLPDNLDGGTAALRLPNGDVASFDTSIDVRALHLNARVVNPPWPLSNPTNFTIDLTSLQATCVSTFTPAPAASMPPGLAVCGDQVLACTPTTTTVRLGQLSTSGLTFIPELAWALEKEDLEGFARVLLLSGVQLHFNNWAVTSVGATPGGTHLVMRGTSTLRPDGTSLCSPTTPAPPPVPPTRGLVTTRTRRGHGELFTKDGWVKPFYIEAELSADFHSASTALPLASRQRLPVAMDGALDHFGREFPPIATFDATQVQTRLNANLRQLDCWRKEARLENFFILPYEQVATWKEGALTEEQAMKMRERRAHVVDLEAADPREVAGVMKDLDRECGDCQGWSRLRLDILDVQDMPFGPPDTFPGAPLDRMPWSMDVFIDANPDALEPYLDPFRKCAEEGGDKWREVAGQRIYSMPTVELLDTMFDSARVESGGYEGVPREDSHSQWSIVRAYNMGQRSYKAIHLLEACLARQGACWEGALKSPPVGQVWVDVATSNTTVPRRAIATAVAGGTIPAYGSRNAAVQGYFDRSRVDLYSAVPQVYVDNGISPAGFDYRGGTMLDWRHDSSFPEPDNFRFDSSFRHADDAFKGWLMPHALPQGRRGSLAAYRYRADWGTDVLWAARSDDGLSYCTLSQDLSVDVDTVGFSGAGLSNEKLVPANLVFPQPTSPVSVSGNARRWGWATPALSP